MTGRSQTFRKRAVRKVRVQRCTSMKPIEYAKVFAITHKTNFNAKKLSNEGTRGNLRMASRYPRLLASPATTISDVRVDPDMYA